MDKRYQVFVSSTYTDLKEERKGIIESLLSAKYIPSGMEMFTASNDEQFKYIKKIIDNCDYYILVVGGRYGTVNPNTGISYTEQEYEYALEKGMPILAFLHSNPDSLAEEHREVKNPDKLAKFRERVSTGRLCSMWETKSDLIVAVINSLNEEVSENPQLGWTRGAVDNTELLQQLNQLRIDMGTLEKRNEKLKDDIAQYENLSNLATGQDEYVIVGSYTEYTGSTSYSGPRKSISVERKVTLSWDDIFSCLAPYLLAPVNYTKFEDKLCDAINSITDKKSYLGRINSDCVQTIKIQLVALGLIEAKPGSTTNHTVAEFIKITKFGYKYLMQLKAIKKH